MISEGDRIAVGVSGGKDSVSLLAGMAMLRKFYPEGSTATTAPLRSFAGSSTLSISSSGLISRRWSLI